MSVISMKQLLEAGGPLWSSDPTLESQNGSVYFHGAKWHLHH